MASNDYRIRKRLIEVYLISIHLVNKTLTLINPLHILAKISSLILNG